MLALRKQTFAEVTVMAEAVKKQQAAFKVAAAYEGDTTVDLSDPFYS